ncbi:E3 ubiquitin-protein ligase At1g63170 isoform X1 [Cryptomeria japonica]|uniref:E3 ubiquitin-protein ligase At1g63170 isoform X1 n=2 Tax=Cryptomeria japonica TaxID=3369 RepID=UPI0025ACDEC9|nr:E3 ubiquitin-protein ligase At1g63170 isoform X1 [Cryptomeria japonica]XP_057871384.1 E3 ubiquitin-protein ligase At1g63170 isoform X1 [Cryptomeria japonica]
MLGGSLFLGKGSVGMHKKYNSKSRPVCELYVENVYPLYPDLGFGRSKNHRCPLLMEHTSERSDQEHIVLNVSTGNATVSVSRQGDVATVAEQETPSTSTQAPSWPVPSSSSVRNASFPRAGDLRNYGRRQRASPLNSGLWISFELTITVSQIIASIIVLSLSRNENPQAPLSVWVVGYASGCLATLPLLYWRYRHRYIRMPDQDPSPSSIASRSSPPLSQNASYTAVSLPQASGEEEVHGRSQSLRSNRDTTSTNPRLNVFVERFKMALDCFFAVWFVVGNVWIFGGHSSSSDAPNLYRLCIVFLTLSCIGYAMPFILCATICCCLPCIISLLGLREDQTQTRGAAPEIIGALPKYKFKAKKSTEGNGSKDDSENHSESSGEGGIIAVGTEKERSVSGEDAMCCICLGKYKDDEDLRELPCTHYFHVECVDKWLKINASCPLCKHEIGESSESASESVGDIRQNGNG